MMEWGLVAILWLDISHVLAIGASEAPRFLAMTFHCEASIPFRPLPVYTINYLGLSNSFAIMDPHWFTLITLLIIRRDSSRQSLCEDGLARSIIRIYHALALALHSFLARWVASVVPPPAWLFLSGSSSNGLSRAVEFTACGWPPIRLALWALHSYIIAALLQEMILA